MTPLHRTVPTFLEPVADLLIQRIVHFVPSTWPNFIKPETQNFLRRDHRSLPILRSHQRITAA
jgi:hypothetical protein